MNLTEAVKHNATRRLFSKTRFRYRLKWSAGMALLIILIGLIGQASAVVWDGSKYDRYEVRYYGTGYIEEYSN